jgi:signal transduction histidine kinase
VSSTRREKAGDGRRRRSALDQLDLIFEETCGRMLVHSRVREHAYERARKHIDQAGGASRIAGMALLGYATDLFLAHAVDLAASQPELSALIAKVDVAGLVPRASLAEAVLRAPELLQLPTAIGIEVQLGLIRAFTEAKAISLWAARPDGEIRRVGHAGSSDDSRNETRRLAGSVLAATRSQERVRGLAGIAIELRGRPAAALVARGKTAASIVRRPLLEAGGPLIAALLERDELFTRGGRSGGAIIASAERRLARLRFDLHDGPQQDVVLLAEDVRLLHAQLEKAMDGHPDQTRLLGRLDDLQARLVAIDGDLRRISAFVQSPFLQEESVPEALKKLADDFAARSAIEPDVRVTGDFTTLTDSQQITLLGLIREALSNVREHSEAEHVTVAVSAGPDGVEATISDDGRGFDPETTLVDAARGGHLGLVGMHERVHMLGGSTQIDSRPGGPTVISVKLPPFGATG